MLEDGLPTAQDWLRAHAPEQFAEWAAGNAKPSTVDWMAGWDACRAAIAGGGARVDADAQDAARYRWLRQQHWNEAPLCVVMRPREAVKLGHDCPALDRLDAAIDEAMGADGVAPTDGGQQ